MCSCHLLQCAGGATESREGQLAEAHRVRAGAGPVIGGGEVRELKAFTL